MRRSFAVTALAAASSVALLTGQASALSPGSLVPAVLLPSGSQHTLAMCAAVPDGAGVGSTGGASYDIEGFSANADTNTVANQVECALYDTDTNTFIAVFESSFEPGVAARVTTNYVVHTSDDFVVCVEASRFDDSGNVESTSWVGPNNSPCGS